MIQEALMGLESPLQIHEVLEVSLENPNSLVNRAPGGIISSIRSILLLSLLPSRVADFNSFTLCVKGDRRTGHANWSNVINGRSQRQEGTCWELVRIHRRARRSRGKSGSRMTAQHEERSCDVLPKEDPEESVASISVKHFGFCGYELKITRFTDINLGVSAFIWESGLTLCRFFEREKMSFCGRKVIELGSGTGIVGILAVMLGGKVTLTDQPHVLKQIKHNVSINVPPSYEHYSTVRALSWGSNHTQFPNDYDVILGSDIVYYPPDYPILIQTLRHLSNQRTTIYIATEMRGCCAALSFHQELIPQYFYSQLVHRHGSEDINVYKLTVRGPSPRNE
ncbi:EEF1A lysine methyltransferase 3-like [Heptranchias perlo]|uniref:EEF1A lysine methyltransferase 3-like n=1 Tax=Heptranchias perlo TaxID=212740 RepID=UPI003559B629